MKDHVEKAVQGRWWYDKALQPQNQKLFPFYIHTNFRINNKTEPVLCEYCGHNIGAERNNGGYFCSNIVFESPSVVKLCCYSCRNTKAKRENMLEYNEQIFGNPDPLKIPDYAKDDPRYIVIFDRLMHSSHLYMLASEQQITDQYLKDKGIWETDRYQGGASPGWGWYEIRGRFLSFKKTMDSKPVFKLTRAQVVDIINDVLAKQNAGQLSLFN